MAHAVRLAAAALLASLALGAAAQEAVPSPATEPDLYLEAMRAISEGRKDDASRALAGMLAKGPDHASEWLDLAMIQCAIGHGDEAEKLFTAIIERFDPPAGIRDIISQQRAQGCRSWKPLRQFSVFAGRGHDRNVNQGASNPSYTLGGVGGATLELLPEFLPQADQYTIGAGDFMMELSESGTVGFAQLLLRRNDNLHAYNTASLFGGVEQPWKLGRWRFRGTALGGVLMLGGRLYQEQAQLQLRVVPPLTLPEGVEVYAVGGVSHVNYKTLTNFNSNMEELRGVVSWRGKQNLAQLSVAYQNDHAVGTRPGGDRSGWTTALTGRRRLAGNWQAELDLSRQTWDGSTAYSAPLITEIRKQDTRVAKATLIYLLNEGQSVHLEARRVQNKDNISFFQYNNTVLQLSWHWNGF
jgi:hypothetical protein